ncbi:hypothetical protein GGX14DRAFT_397173 [Mycena pura]|uniref:Hydrophobin n=1 Tax=Mycena pura TaxID=153505 RepID=A0AAD6YCY1_9AGAR|nr:hypothetical protein GGX14DRAFT_397173 [Mycena pura]
MFSKLSLLATSLLLVSCQAQFWPPAPSGTVNLCCVEVGYSSDPIIAAIANILGVDISGIPGELAVDCVPITAFSTTCSNTAVNCNVNQLGAFSRLTPSPWITDNRWSQAAASSTSSASRSQQCERRLCSASDATQTWPPTGVTVLVTKLVATFVQKEIVRAGKGHLYCGYEYQMEVGDQSDGAGVPGPEWPPRCHMNAHPASAGARRVAAWISGHSSGTQAGDSISTDTRQSSIDKRLPVRVLAKVEQRPHARPSVNDSAIAEVDEHVLIGGVGHAVNFLHVDSFLLCCPHNTCHMP